MTVKLSDKTALALEIIGKNSTPDDGIRPSEFARLFFPADHPGWQRHMNGRNSVNKNFLFLYSGSYLGKLWRKGLLQTRWNHHVTAYCLSPLGEASLKERKKRK